jgi:ubiquinone/menaquinone biosynthesis C-methylase UbiE
MSASNSAFDENSYFIDAENAAEMARLTGQDRLLTRTMEGLFPSEIDLSGVHGMLDIACGPGGWVLDVAAAYPEKQVTGIDISRSMVEYAKAQAREKGLGNAHFRVMDAHKTLDFPNSSLDLVNARFLTGFMTKAAWPQLVLECVRVLRPGGVIRLTEFETTISNSPAAEKLFAMSTRAVQMTNQAFSPGGNSIGITPMLGRFLRDAGCENIQKRAYVLDSSFGEDGHASQYQNAMVFFKLLQPFLIKSGITTQEEVEMWYQRAMAEMASEDYCAVFFLMSAWGAKP